MRHRLPALAGLHVLGILLATPDAGARWLWFGLHAGAVGLASARLRMVAALGVSLAAGGLSAGRALDTARTVPGWEAFDAVVEGRVVEVAGESSGRRLSLRDVTTIEPRGRGVPRGLLLFAGDAPPLARAARGDWLRVEARITPARGPRNPGGPDFARALARRGIGGLATPRHPGLSVRLQGSGFKRPNPLGKLRERGIRGLTRHGPGGSLLAALGLGERGGLAPPFRAALARLGLAHLVAVSGLHLVLVAAPLYLALAGVVRRSAALSARVDTRRVALVGACAGAALYASLTGFGAPIQRALAFLLALALAQWLRRPPRASTAFAAAALSVCALDPAAPFAPGVQLSFVATAALVWSRPARAESAPGTRGGVVARLGDGAVVARLGDGAVAVLQGAVAVLRASASAGAATAGLAAFHFGLVSPIGWVSNALAVPFTSLLLLPLALASSLLAGSAADAEPLLASACGLAAGLVEGCLRLAPYVPAWTAVEPGAPALVASSVMAFACVRARRTVARLALAGLAATTPALGAPPRIDPPPPRAVFLDVGQGDAALVQGRRAAVLVDGGRSLHTDSVDFDAGERIVRPALAALGVRGLDLVVASHADLDHRGGLVAVLRSVPVARLWLPPGGRAEPGFAALREAAAWNGSAVAERAADEPALALGDLCVETLWPPRRPTGLARNDASLVVRVSAGASGVLFAGDLEATGEAGLLASGAPLGAAVLKLAHHGSRSSSGAAFLRAVDPDFAVVSAPRGGRFGMPHPEVRGRLARLGVPWGWTGRDGALLVGLGGGLAPRVRGWARPGANWALPARPEAACARVASEARAAVEGRAGPHRGGAADTYRLNSPRAAKAFIDPGSGAGVAPRRRAAPRGRRRSDAAAGRAPPGARRPRAAGA